MKALSYLFQQTTRIMLAVMAAYIASLAAAGGAYANTWTDCSGEWGECTIDYNSAPGATVRYGASGVYSFKYNVSSASIACTNGEFGDPKPGTPKRCWYSFNSPSRGATTLALYSIVPSDFNIDDHDEFLAHTLSEGESMLSSNGQYQLAMQADGNLVLSKIAGSDQGVKWASGTSFPNTGSALYRFHVTHKGIEIRKNGSVIWSRYPSTNQNKNYALHITNAGFVNLVDMEDRYSRWFVEPSSGTDTLRNTQVFDGVLAEIWTKMGWDHHQDWTATDHTQFRYLRNTGSHWHFHAMYETLDEINESIESNISDSWNETKTVLGDLIDDPLGIQGVENIVDDGKNAAEVRAFAKGLAKLVNHLDAGELDLGDLFEEEIERVLNQEVLSTEMGHMIDAIETSNTNLGRRLSNASTDASCKRLCGFLSRSHNENMRVDYAIEVSPTFIRNSFKAKQFVQGDWVNQVQFRLFFTHPRVNGDGRFTTQIRLRLIDYSGYVVDLSFKNEVITPTTNPSVGAIAVHDIILPYTWGKGQKFRHHARFEGPLYASTTGILAELDLAFTTGSFDLQQATRASTYLVEEITQDNIDLGSMRASDVFTSPTLSTIGADAGSVVEETSNIPTRFNNATNLTIEAGVGLGAVFVYDLRKMKAIAEVSSVGAIITRILVTEALESAAVVSFGFWSKVNQAAAEEAEGYKASLTLANAEAIAGGMAGDLTYYWVHRWIHGKTNAILASGAGFAWVAGRINPFAYVTTSLPGKFAAIFGEAGDTSTAPKARFQLNWSWETREWFGRRADRRRLSEYGNVQLRTKHNKCIAKNSSSTAVIQEDCSTSQRHIWQSNRTGAGEFFEFRSLDNGNCIGIPDSGYGAANTVNNGVTTTASACDTVAVRWNIDYIGDNKVMLKSALDPTKCLDLSAGSSNNGAAMDVWSCSRNNANQHFKIHNRNGIRDTTTRHTIRMAGDLCIDNEASSGNPPNGTHFDVKRCIDSGLNRQDWKFKARGSGWYQIQMYGMNKYLDVSKRSQSDDQLVHAWTASSGENQHWKPVVKDDGTVQLMARHSSKCLELSTSGNTSGKLVQFACDDKKSNQRFVISNAVFKKFGGYDGNPDKGNRDDGFIIDDNLPAGARVLGNDTSGGVWPWLSSLDPYSGSKVHISSNNSGIHQHYLLDLDYTLQSGDTFSTWVFFNSATSPSGIQIQIHDGITWRRVHWGAQPYGPSKSMGPLPASSQWINLKADFSDFGISPTATVEGIAFTLRDGEAAWDYTVIGNNN
ncbi:MAG: hypothetical protein ACJAYF_001145 [Arenicella sp.]|jgi:hypothetical protein